MQHVIDVATWSEQAGRTAILVYTDNSIVHPYSVAKMVASFAHFYGRRM